MKNESSWKNVYKQPHEFKHIHSFTCSLIENLKKKPSTTTTTKITRRSIANGNTHQTFSVRRIKSVAAPVHFLLQSQWFCKQMRSKLSIV